MGIPQTSMLHPEVVFHRMGGLSCTFLLLGLVVAGTLAGMIDQDLICDVDRYDRVSDSYVPMEDVASVEEIAWECNTDTVPGGVCDKIQANCYTNHIDVKHEDYVEYIYGDDHSYCQRLCEGVFTRVQRLKNSGLPPVLIANAINRMKAGNRKRPFMQTMFFD